MTRTNLLAQLLRALRTAHYAEQHDVGTAEAQGRLAELAYREALLRRDRRDFLKTVTSRRSSSSRPSSRSPRSSC